MAKSLSSLTAGEVMTVPAAYVMVETPLREIANLLLRERISAVPVLDEAGCLAGVVSEGDLVRRRSAEEGGRRSWWLDLFEATTAHNEQFRNYLKTHGLRAKDVMTRAVITVATDTPIAQVAELFETHGIKRVPVVRDGRVIGIVSRANLLRVLVHGSPPASRG